MSLSVDLKFQWPMGHRILGLNGPGAKCRNIHGHNWEALIEFPNDSGKLEFGEIKTDIGDFVDAYWDHGFILDETDPFVQYLEANDLKLYTLKEPPTTENIAHELADQAYHRIGVVPNFVHVVEGFRNAATWRNEPAK